MCSNKIQFQNQNKRNGEIKFIRNSISIFADNELYSGTVADFSGSDPIIYREPLQTEQYDSLSLNGKLIPLRQHEIFNVIY